MKILQIIGGLASSSGTTPAVLALCDRLAAAGHKTDIFYVSGRTADTVRPSHPDVGIQGFPLTGPKRWAGSYSLYRELMARAGEYDIVHGYSLWLFTNLALSKACQRAGRPYIISPQGAFDGWALKHHGHRKRFYYGIIEKSILNRAACIQCVTSHESSLVLNLELGSKTAVIPNGVETSPVDLASKPYPLEILFLSRLHPKKGLELLIPAFSRAKHECSGIRLTIAGSDGGSGYGKTVKAMVSAHGLNDCVRFAGELRGAEKKAAFDEAGMFILPSLSEGHPLAVLEAMERGLPVIITRECYIPEVQEQGAGLVAAADFTGLAAAIVRMASSEARRKEMGQKARLLVEAQYSMDRVVSMQLELYKEIISGGG